MPSPGPKLTCDALIQLLDNRRRPFAEKIRPLSVMEEERFQRANELILDDKPMYYIRKKARSIYISIRDYVGYDVFLLCTLVQSISQFGRSQLGTDYVDNIEKWWRTVESPKDLRQLARLKSGKEQSSYEIHGDVEQRTESRTPEIRSTLEDHPETTILHFELDDLTSFLQWFEKDLPFKFTGLISFLKQFEDTCPKLHLTCPWQGEPLPTIYIIFSPDFSTTTEVSVEMCKNLLKYLKSRAGGENIATTANQRL
ncbi:hypothetical protein VE04_07964 [Pseudogymnoascus sp. 24MN13]|nr:hypothetical protein VE04_07964 [Pseudogymnoascus sp. 24MN13]